MGIPENLEIAHLWIFGILPLPLLIYLLLPPKRIRSASLKVPNLAKTQEYTGETLHRSALIKKKGWLSYLGLSMIWCLLVVALSSPQLVAEPEMKVKTSRNFLIVADISFSMAQTDWISEGQRVRRWDGVKHVMHDFISKREGDRMGLIFFGSSAYVQAPFTSDLATVDLLLEEADVGMAGQMTNIGKAIVKGIELFEKDTIETKVMLLLTDGVDAGTDILPLDAADMARKDSILVYTIGIGDPNSGNSDLDEPTLEQISSMTDAQYFRAIDEQRLNQIYDELNRLQPIEYEEESFQPKTLLFHYPLLAALIIAIIQSLASIISNRFNQQRQNR